MGGCQPCPPPSGAPQAYVSSANAPYRWTLLTLGTRARGWIHHQLVMDSGRVGSARHRRLKGIRVAHGSGPGMGQARATTVHLSTE
jgi:hypothetical protein